MARCRWSMVVNVGRRRTSWRRPDHGLPVFGDRVGGPLRRSSFRRRLWLPALVRARLPGHVVSDGIPINAARKVMCHRHASTTLNHYTLRTNYAAGGPGPFNDVAGFRSWKRGRRRRAVSSAHSSVHSGRRGDDPRRGEAGVALGSGSGGVSRTHSTITGGVIVERLGTRSRYGHIGHDMNPCRKHKHA